MALDKAGLIAGLAGDLQAIFQDLDPEATAADKAHAIADAIGNRVDAFVRTATVSTTVAVQSVSLVTPGQGASGPGAGTGTGSLS